MSTSCRPEVRDITQDQAAVIAFLSSPSTHGGEAVERIDTHASVVFLAGSRAWKLTRAVRRRRCPAAWRP